ncbi:MAG TPA: RNA-directed DNA polymerase [Candidatus Nanoarchaeia archaeon]|nr:RNA-directed DNA polymerase [Candidatus Nanoarchaeia archaeon]
MPLGNLTSQFFANVYLNELDYFVKHVLKIECYIRYVDDFVILHESREQLEKWKSEINYFLQNKLKLTLHPQKSRIASLSSGVDFVGFRNFYYHCLLRKRSLRKMMRKIEMFHRGEKDFGSLMDNYQGWQAHAQWAHTRKTREKIRKLIAGALLERI